MDFLKEPSQDMLTARNIFIANLAVCDILLCVFTIPLALFDILTFNFGHNMVGTCCEIW